MGRRTEIGSLEGESLETGGGGFVKGTVPIEHQKGDTREAEGQDMVRDTRQGTIAQDQEVKAKREPSFLVKNTHSISHLAKPFFSASEIK